MVLKENCGMVEPVLSVLTGFQWLMNEIVSNVVQFSISMNLHARQGKKAADANFLLLDCVNESLAERIGLYDFSEEGTAVVGNRPHQID